MYISDERMNYIETRVDQFCKKYLLFLWPIDCVKLLNDFSETGQLPLSIAYEKMPKNVDAIAVKDKSSHHTIFFNVFKHTYPFRCSKDRRLNFTYAHELGHIILGHCDIPDEYKTAQQRMQEDHEADHFAATLLMPKKLFESCNFLSVEAVAYAFNVSDEAVKVRAKVLGLDTSVLIRKAEKLCKKCITGYEKCKAKCEKCFDLQDSYENKLILKSNMLYTPVSYCNDFAVSKAEVPIFRDQLQIENWLFELYDNISGVLKWENFLEKCDEETQYFLINSYVVIADNSLIFCPHKFPYEHLDDIWAEFLNYLLKQFAYSLKIRSVLVVDREYFEKYERLPTLNKWLKALYKKYVI